MPGDGLPYEIILSRSVKHALSDVLPAGAAFAAVEFIYGPPTTRSGEGSANYEASAQFQHAGEVKGEQ